MFPNLVTDKCHKQVNIRIQFSRNELEIETEKDIVKPKAIMMARNYKMLGIFYTQTARQKYSTYFFYWWPSTPICTQILTEQQLQMREVHLTLITDDPWFMDHKGKAVLGRFHLAVTSGYLTTGIHQICTTLQIQDQQSGIIFRRIVNSA